ncbi:hypothetical protein HMPREF9441_00714 [Paraprevotella clara YIT 11840]|uniref:Uncharacterized protein n=1 Tax=Paraprevotella clara YIT 11840 TaxID=762968 RepID=G5SMY7_9BACT|nr:hypothetical protein HMPREF9441_00714 [Paraprevotella clara YIT 11840]
MFHRLLQTVCPQSVRRRIFVFTGTQQGIFSAAQNVLSIAKSPLPLQGAGFLSEVGKPV